MNLPKKITPDRIRESIVQVFFITDIPFEPLVGYVFGALQDGFQYTNRPFKQTQDLFITTPLPIPQNEYIIFPQHFYFNEEIKIQLHQNGSLIFNCINEYIGWSKYFEYIQSVITELYQKEIIKTYTRIGVRYVSEFPNIDILENINFSFTMGGLNKQISNGSFRLEWKEETHKLIVNLGSKLPLPAIIEAEGTKIEFVSLVDIDVIDENLNISELDVLLELVSKAHKKQKMIFFGLLKEEFLNTLNPEY